MRQCLLAFVAAFASIIATNVFAGEWHAERLRGVVLMMVEDQWVPIERGMVIPDARVIRTGANGQVTFRSGDQLIDLSRDTQIQISAAQGRDHTWILHAGGELTADVEARDVEHFGVRTAHMVAVVKGTRFTVSADEDAADVSVERGTVAVNESERGLSVSITSGQRATGGNGRLQVGGEGDLPDVVDVSGRPLPIQEARIDPPAGPTSAGEANAQQDIVAPEPSEGNGSNRDQVGPPDHSNAGGSEGGNNDDRGRPSHSNAGGHRSGDNDDGGPPSQSNEGGHGHDDDDRGPPSHSNAGGRGNDDDDRGPPSHSNAGGKRH